jgi:hypothetical protein
MDHVVRATLSLAQADDVADALDLSSRIMMGQLSEIASLARMGRLPVRDTRCPSGSREATAEEADLIEEHMRAAAAVLGHRGGSFGIGSPSVPVAARRQYEFKKVLEKAVSDHRNPGGKGNRHDGLIVRYTPEEEPTARVDRRGGSHDTSR